MNGPSRPTALAMVALSGLAGHGLMVWLLDPRTSLGPVRAADLPLVATLLVGGLPLLWDLARRAVHQDFGSDWLAGLSILTAVLLGELLAGALVVLMLSGGQALEAYAVGRASSALQALARRMPTHARRRHGGGTIDVPLEAVAAGDLLLVLPHETCPVDGTVVEGRSTMDESYLTGEPYVMSKAVGLDRPVGRRQRRRRARPSARTRGRWTRATPRSCG